MRIHGRRKLSAVLSRLTHLVAKDDSRSPPWFERAANLKHCTSLSDKGRPAYRKADRDTEEAAADRPIVVSRCPVFNVLRFEEPRVCFQSGRLCSAPHVC